MFKILSLKKISSLKSLLIYWIVGSAVAFVIFYSALLEHQFHFGVQLRSQATFDWHAQKFDKTYANNKNTPLPTGLNLQSYLGNKNLPPLIIDYLNTHDLIHREIDLFVDTELLNKEVEQLFSALKICDGHICEVIFFYSYQLFDGSWLYMLQGIKGTEEIEKKLEFADRMIFFITLAVLVIFGGLAFLLVGKVTRPVKALAGWAENLHIDSLSNHKPNFQYQELNQVASKLTEAFMRVKDTVEKEHQFLQQVSHELRTPLATASGNLEILALITKNKELSEPEQKALSRLNFSINDMKQLTETLLWLNRDQESLPEQIPISLHAIVDDIVQTNQYLLQDKQVKVDTSGEIFTINGHEVLTHIVLSNLIRNAFQYTYEGEVNITVSKYCITIKNRNSHSEEHDNSGDEIYGFGLGLHLVKQITERMGWEYHYQQQSNGWHASVNFCE